MTTAAIILGLLLAGGGFIFYVRRQERRTGYRQAQGDADRLEAEQGREAKKIDDRVAGLSDKEVDDELAKDATDAADRRNG